MFSFFGSKSKIVNLYPEPKYDSIIEPFCGSARYSLKYFEKDIWIYDIDPVIIGVWKYLQKASPKDILSLPDVPNATVLESIDGFSQLAQEEKWLIGFCSNGGSAQPKHVSGRHNFNSFNLDKIRISKNLYKIKHWHIVQACYDEILNRDATWFIDSPYIDKGKYYKHNKINYDHLSKWCLSRKGCIIVCEAGSATWMNFRPLREIPFTHYKKGDNKGKKTLELIWTKGF